MIWVAVVVLALIGVVVYDITQRTHAILRNFPIVGHFRYLFESVGPELRQYIVTGNNEERPFSRDQRRWVYASSKHQNNYFGFGTDNDLEQSSSYIIVKQVAFPIRVFARMGIKAVILTNAAGGINLGYSQGALVLIRDHINLQGSNPLVGPNDDRFGVRFPDMTHAYSREYRQIAREESARLNILLYEGVYAALLGPSYETPAEIEYLRRIGADLVGMSTAAEVSAARHMGLDVLAISCVTNMAAGILDQPLSHAEVMETGERVKSIFEALLRAVLPRISAQLT